MLSVLQTSLPQKFPCQRQHCDIHFINSDTKILSSISRDASGQSPSTSHEHYLSLTARAVAAGGGEGRSTRQGKDKNQGGWSVLFCKGLPRTGEPLLCRVAPGCSSKTKQSACENPLCHFSKIKHMKRLKNSL